MYEKEDLLYTKLKTYTCYLKVISKSRARHIIISNFQ